MSRSFERDPYPGRPRVLFIGLAESTHTHSWIDLLEGAELNVRLFALPTGLPPKDWWVRAYLTAKSPFEGNPSTTARLYSHGRAGRLVMRGISHYLLKNDLAFEERWLAQIVRCWRPDVVHTLGLDPAGEFYFRVRERFGLGGMGRWVLQLRGGSDLSLSRLDPERAEQIGERLRECDQLLSDNRVNFRYAMEMGARQEQWSMLGTIPGTGGVDVAAVAKASRGRPSQRRTILWPKAYESPWSKALPVFEALRMCWDRIQPCDVHMFAMTPEVRMWYRDLPEAVRRRCHIESRMPREVILGLVTQARVMLIPSLVDGTPNSLFEAMAAGAFPILSPLETITAIVENEKNVLFARNLYPEEIAEALVRAMTDDELVDRAAERNLELVRRLADREEIRPRVVNFYHDLAGKANRR